MYFQDLILTLQNHWARQGCIIAQPYDLEVGAGTMAPSTFLRALGPEPRENLPGGLGEPARKVALKLLEELSRAGGSGRFVAVLVVVPAARVPGAPR